MQRRLLALILGATLLMAANAASAAVPSTLTIRYNTSTENLHGKVRSSDTECVVNRRVKVFRKTASGPSFQGRVRTNGNGRWVFHAMDAHGRYFAVAPRYEAMGDTVCRRDRSPTLDVM